MNLLIAFVAWVLVVLIGWLKTGIMIGKSVMGVVLAGYERALPYFLSFNRFSPAFVLTVVINWASYRAQRGCAGRRRLPGTAVCTVHRHRCTLSLRRHCRSKYIYIYIVSYIDAILLLVLHPFWFSCIL